MHQAIYDIGAVALRRAENGRIPKEYLVADVRVGADALAFPEVFIRVVGVQRVDSHLELLSIACCVGLTRLAPINFRKLQAVHERNNAVIGGDEVFAGKMPIRRVLKGVFLDSARDAGHFPQANAAPETDDPGEENGTRNRSGVLLL